MDSDRIVEVEALCRDGFRDPSDTADEDGGFYSMMGDADIDWPASLVRSTIGTIGVVLGFLETRFLVPIFYFGLGIVGFDCEWGTTWGIITAKGVVIIRLNDVNSWKAMDCIVSPEGSVKFAIICLRGDICCSIWRNIGSKSYFVSLFLLLPDASPVDSCGLIPSNRHLYFPFVISYATLGHEPTSVWNVASVKVNFCGLI